MDTVDAVKVNELLNLFKRNFNLLTFATVGFTILFAVMFMCNTHDLLHFAGSSMVAAGFTYVPASYYSVALFNAERDMKRRFPSNYEAYKNFLTANRSKSNFNQTTYSG